MTGGFKARWLVWMRIARSSGKERLLLSGWKAVILPPLGLPFPSLLPNIDEHSNNVFFNNFAGSINVRHLHLSWRLRTCCYKKGLSDTCGAAQHSFFFSSVSLPPDPNCSKQGGWIMQCIFHLKGRAVVFSSFFQSWMINNSPFCIRTHNFSKESARPSALQISRGAISKPCIAKLSLGVVWKRSG